MGFTIVLSVLTTLFVYRAVATEISNPEILFKMSKEARDIRSRRWVIAGVSVLMLSYRIWG